MKDTTMNTGAGLDLTKKEFERACELLPPDFFWGLPVTPRLVLDIAQAALATPQAYAAPSELASMTRMFHAACADLGAINEALGLDPDDGGAAPILDAIAELKSERDKWVDAGYAASANASQAGAAIAAGGAQEADVLEWIETELSAISCRYHGDPSYDHDAYWMKDRVMKLIADARKAFPLPRVAATVATDVLATIKRLRKNPDRGDEVFRCGYNACLDTVLKVLAAPAAESNGEKK
jgi:hypothetical protein